MICNKCGTENSESSKFCRSCGNPLNIVQDNIPDNNSDLPENGIVYNSSDEYNSAEIHPDQNVYEEAAAERHYDDDVNIPQQYNSYQQEQNTPVEEPANNSKKTVNLGLFIKKALNSVPFFLATLLFTVASLLFVATSIPGIIDAASHISDKWTGLIALSGASVLCIIIAVGLWISFVTSVGNGKCKSAGLTVLGIASSLACMASAGFFIAVIFSTVFEALTYGFDMIIANISDFLIMYAFLLFTLIFCSKIFSAVSTAKKAVKLNFLFKRPSGALPFFCILYGLCTAIYPVFTAVVLKNDVGIISIIICFAFGISALFSGINIYMHNHRINKLFR